MFAPTKILSAFGAVALLASAGAASAEEFVSNGKTVEVRFGDLNLTKEADQKQLRGRISKAAMKVCMDTSTRTVNAQCRWQAINQVKAPVAAAIARAENGDRYADASDTMAVGAGN